MFMIVLLIFSSLLIVSISVVYLLPVLYIAWKVIAHPPTAPIDGNPFKYAHRQVIYGLKGD